MKLVYINYIGEDWMGNQLYEFLFSNDIESVDGEDWDAYPASSNNPVPPSEDYINKVGRLSSDLKLELIQHSDTFAVWDAVDGLIALGWEDLSDYDEYPEKRLFFTFGNDIKQVEDALFERDLHLEYNNIGKPIKNEE